MIYLIYGSDIQKSRRKLQEIINEYRKKAGDGFDFHQFDAEEDDFGKFKEALKSSSLFTPKKLLVVKYLSLSPWSREEFFKLLKNARGKSGTTIVLWDRELGREEVAALKPNCDGVDELKKSANNESVTNLRITNDNKEIFRLGDAFFAAGRKRDALRSLFRLLENGEDPARIFFYLSGHLRTLAAAKHSSMREVPPPPYLKIHPYVAQKATVIARDIPLPELQATVRRFFDEDFKIKNGLSKPEESLFNLLSGSR